MLDLLDLMLEYGSVVMSQRSSVVQTAHFASIFLGHSHPGSAPGTLPLFPQGHQEETAIYCWPPTGSWESVA